MQTQGSENNLIVVGVDEAGRGPLAGPVVAAAVILNPAKPIVGLADSKVLTPKQREHLFSVIQSAALAWATGSAEVEEIDQINILQATFLAMQRAVSALSLQPQLALIDGNRSPKLMCQTKTIIEGDKKIPAISAASIVAKVTRDRHMVLLHEEFPHYGFDRHKGYGTREHIAALKKYGICRIHRRTYAPVASIIEM